MKRTNNADTGMMKSRIFQALGQNPVAKSGQDRNINGDGMLAAICLLYVTRWIGDVTKIAIEKIKIRKFTGSLTITTALARP